MIIKTTYVSDLTPNLGFNKKNILSFNREVKNDELPINELGWGFILNLVLHKLKHKIYFLVYRGMSGHYFYDFFYINKFKTKKYGL